MKKPNKFKRFMGQVFTNLGNVILVFTKPSGVTWMIIGARTGFELTQNFMLLTLGIIGVKVWRRVKEKV